MNVFAKIVILKEYNYYLCNIIAKKLKINSIYILLATMLWLMASCSSVKPDEQSGYLLGGVEIKSDSKLIDESQLMPYIRQQAASRLSAMLKFNRYQAVVYDTLLAQQTCNDLRTALQNMGYMNASVEVEERVKGRKLKAIYKLHPGEPYFIRSVKYDIRDERIDSLLTPYLQTKSTLKGGLKFSANQLDDERKRITTVLQDSGFYRFNKDFIHYVADTVKGSRLIDLTMQMAKYRSSGGAPETLHPRYMIRHINYLSGDEDSLIRLRRKVLEENTWLEEGKPFSATHLQRTYNNFGKMQAVRYTNIRFTEVPDTTLLDATIQISTNKPSTISFQPEGTNTSGDLGAAASLTYENRNLFRGSETFSIQLRGAFEAITGLEGYQNQDYMEYSVEAKLGFPRFVAPFMSKSFRRRSAATSELSLSYDMQNRPEFHRRVFSTAWRYHWSNASRQINYKLDLIDLDYVYMPWISAKFKNDYLDSVSNRNAILRYNYEDLFIMKVGFGLTYNDGRHAWRANVETAGNLLNGVSEILGRGRNDRDQYTLFNIAFAQYVKGDFDYTRIVSLAERQSLVFHAGLGIAYPYGNSRILPFEKRYFSGGANSVRGWSVRSLGPGSFKGNKGAIDFINQTGDMKLDLNLEYRTYLFWKFDGALFVDAGNIWTLRNYEDQPGGQFRFDEFYKQIAMAYGLGFRLNFGYFALRFDMGMKAVNPAYETEKEHWAIFHPNLHRDFSFHFAVGLPF